MIDLGIDVLTEKFLEAVKRQKPQILGMSSLLTTTREEMRPVTEVLKKEGLRDQIGADGYAPDAISAVPKVKELLCLD